MSEFLKTMDLIDRKIVVAVSLWRTPLMTWVMRFFTETGRGYAWMTYAIFLNLLLVLNINLFVEQHLILKAMFAPLLGWGLGKSIKVMTRRKRPFQSIENFMALTHSPLNDSFPSLHAISTTAFCTALFLYHHLMAPWTLVWAMLVIFSRLYLGVHYFSDLIAGVILGILCGSLIPVIY